MARRSDACGDKFRAMLRCVEQRASSTACAAQVSDFLACERAVLRAARASSSPSSPVPRPSSSKGTSPPPLPSSSSARQPPPSRSASSAPQSTPSAIRRIVAKQTEASVALLRTARRPNALRDSRRFATKMVFNFSLTLRAISTRAVNAVKDLLSSKDGRSPT